jgi:hypothetical protein
MFTLGTHIGLARRVLTHQNHGQARGQAMISLQSGNIAPDLFTQGFSDQLGVDDLSLGHGTSGDEVLSYPKPAGIGNGDQSMP